MRQALWLVPIFAIALAVRLLGSSSLPPSLAEATGASAALLPLDLEMVPARQLAALLGALAATLICALFLGEGRRLLLGCAALLTLFDPLSLAACHEAGPGGALSLASALLVLLVMKPPANWPARIGCGLASLLLVGGAMPGDPGALAALPADATLVAWQSVCGDALGAPLWSVHHLGYALLPLAVAGLLFRRGALLGMLVLVAAGLALLMDGGEPRRLSACAGLAPPLLALALNTIRTIARREGPGLPLSTLGVTLLVLAVNAPLLVSDLKSGQRFPLPVALDRLDDSADVPIVTTTPALIRSSVDRQSRTIRELPADLFGLERMLQEDRPLDFVLPVEGGRLYASADPSLLERIEFEKLADFEIRVKRFDLYRYEIRVFRIR